ncbi:helix-turn-helix domain-containing protein [Falsibacillus albus]|uniref:AraC family transcriptional regulator n=1 Tax=Falsibacillus albus TaxID=2478915 RepID=A0A3L7JUP4_9BACI|nr:AraC family transcriptional regulator [Falsibacillus albus]RLQ93819.1 AraC family transcriptional regulator [Falsibacillus albus]
MSINIHYCGYSQHVQPFFSYYKSGFPAYLFRLQTEGSCEITAKGTRMEVNKGDLLLIQPGEHYELSIREKNENINEPAVLSGDYHLVCEGKWIEDWWRRSVKPTISRIDLDAKLLSLWHHLIVEERRPGEANELSGYLLKALCLSIERMVNETSFPYVVTRMLRFIEEHATTAFKLEDAASHSGLSVSRAAHLFKESVGKTMIEYALEIRLSEAVERMKYTSMTLEQIAEECGFGTYPYFHRMFHRKYGIAPGVYRRER